MARTLVGIVIALSWASLLFGQAAGDTDPEHAAKRTKGLEIFRSEVRKILKDKCLSCHGGDAIEGKLDLGSQEGLFKGGERGPAAVIGRGEKSLLTRLIKHQQEPAMPKDDERLSEREIAAIVNWIDLGAPYDEPLIARKADSVKWIDRKLNPDAKTFWSFQPLQKVAPPAVNDPAGWCQSPIDQFILQKLVTAKLQPNGSVGRAALIRRLYFDLIGLPPTAEQVTSFEQDPRPDAYERLVEELLANPHYGERWGRFWLDLARFAESHGFEHDYDRPSAYHYRDFVVQALNQGMPYDQFVRWQIAGDELAPNDRQAMMATGYLAAGVHSTQITKNEVEKHRYDEMDDMLNTVGTSMLGLSIGCARCHDHKFDPIPQADYYRLLSSFTKTIRSEVELDFDPEGYRRRLAAFELAQAPYEQAVRDYEANQLPQRFAEWQSKRDPIAENPAWMIPSNVQFKSHGGATFVAQPDGSWLSTGSNPNNDHWTVTFETNLRDLRSIRLEALAHPSLTKSAPDEPATGISLCRNSSFQFDRAIRPLTALINRSSSQMHEPRSSRRGCPWLQRSMITLNPRGLSIPSSVRTMRQSSRRQNPSDSKGARS